MSDSRVVRFVSHEFLPCNCLTDECLCSASGLCHMLVETGPPSKFGECLLPERAHGDSF